jgi:hypothetical protein
MAQARSASAWPAWVLRQGRSLAQHLLGDVAALMPSSLMVDMVDFP